MSESIKQNYNDIQNVTSEVDRIKRVVDSLYDQFTGAKPKAQTEPVTTNNKTNKTTKRRKVIGWTLGAVALSAIIASIVIGFALLTTPTPNRGSTVPLTSLTPSTAPGLKQLTHANYERNMLLELYDAIWANSTKPQWNFTEPHCSWYGIRCNTTTGRVIHIFLPLAFSQRIGAATIPSIIGNFTELVSLDLQNNYIASTIPESIKNLKNLVYLTLSDNPLVGTLPDLSGLDKLNQLNIGSTLLSMNESSLATLMQLQSLESLWLQQVTIDGELPSNISNSLTIIDLSNCGLRGTIPTSWVNSSIQHLYISRNNLTGSIPCFGREVLSLDASHNDFDGEFCGTEFRRLLQLTLTDTKLTGVFDLPNVDVYGMAGLFIQRNRFTSFMPSTMNNTDGPFSCLVLDNPFQCPIPKWAQVECHATCN